MEHLFKENYIYTFDVVCDIATTAGMTVVDCIKDDAMIQLEELFIDETGGKYLGGECLFEFDCVGDGFVLRWHDFGWQEQN